MKKINRKKTFIIAEAGVNHNGQLKKALKLIDSASSAGADAIKFQTFETKNLVTKLSPKARYQVNKNKKKETQFQMLKKIELTKDMHYKCIKYCKKKKIIFISSAFDEKSLFFLKKLNIIFFKVPSGEINNIPYLELLGSFKKKIILSTGMSNIKEISQAIKTLVKSGTARHNIALLQCTSSYPAPFEEINLRVMNNLKKKFKLPVGFSDHSLGPTASIAAVALEAEIIEKHITLNKKLSGPDHKSSLDPNEFKMMVDNIRIVEKILGNEKKKITKSEIKNIKIVRKSVVASKFIKINETFTKENITCKRPGTGISPILFKKILGKKSTKNYDKDNFIKFK
jgi:N,N'-diacetyllegionaminate synthase